MSDRPGQAALRRGRCSLTGQIYCLTTVTASRRRLFEDFFLARVLVAEMRAAHRDGWVTSLAFTVMPDHLHWLVRLHGVGLATVMQRVKGRSSRRFALGSPGWQGGFYDRALRNEEDLVVAAWYIVMNPVRAGLVSSPFEYPHWDCVWL